MSKYILKRIALLVLTLFIVITVVFFLLELMDEYPAAILRKIEEAKSDAEKQAIIANYEEHGGALTRYWNYLTGIFQWKFGTYYNEPTTAITTVFSRPLKWTFMITVPAFIIGTLFGLLFGFISGYKRGKWPDIVVNIIAVLFVSIPSFVLATFLLIFAKNVGLPFDFQTAQNTGRTLLGLVLPITIISITSFSTLTYYIRNEVVEVLTSDYIAVARAKGNSEWRVFSRHVLRNVSIPLVTIVIPSFVYIIMGSFIIEIFFNVPGSSSVFVNGIREREKYIVLFSVLFFSSLGMLIQIVVDMIYVVLDPRIKIAPKTGIQPISYFKAYLSRKKELKQERSLNEKSKPKPEAKIKTKAKIKAKA